MDGKTQKASIEKMARKKILLETKKNIKKKTDSYWLDFNKGIKFGYGDEVGQNIIMSIDEELKDIKTIGFSSWNSKINL